jgi:hypothetical protein
MRDGGGLTALFRGTSWDGNEPFLGSYRMESMVGSANDIASYCGYPAMLSSVKNMLMKLDPL